jgi:hypothetical protein
MTASSPKRGRPPGPRIRTFKPERYQDERFMGVSRDARHLYDGLTTRADDEGRGSANPALIRANVFPYDEDIAPDTLEGWLGELAAADLVEIYEAEGRRYFSLVSWADDQRIDRATPSTVPLPPSQVNIPREESRGLANDHDDSASSQAGPDRTGTGTGTTTGSAPERAERVKHGGKLVPADRLTLAEAIVADFNAQAGTSYGTRKGTNAPSENLSRVLTAIGDHPDITADVAQRMIAVQLARPYWQGRPDLGNVFGPRVVERNLEDARNPVAPGGTTLVAAAATRYDQGLEAA